MGRACFQGFGLESRNVACAEFNVSRFSLYVSRVIFTQRILDTHTVVHVCWKEMHFEVGTQKFTLGSMPRPVLYFCTIMLVLYVNLSGCLFAFFPPIHRHLADVVQDPQGI